MLFTKGLKDVNIGEIVPLPVEEEAPKEEKKEEPEDVDMGMGCGYGRYDDDEYEGGSVDSSQYKDIWTVEKALQVLRFEAKLRTGKEY